MDYSTVFDEVINARKDFPQFDTSIIDKMLSAYHGVIELFLERFAESRYPKDMRLVHDNYSYRKTGQPFSTRMATVYICDREGKQLAEIWIELTEEYGWEVKGRALECSG